MTTFEKIKRVIATDFSVDAERITMEANLFDDLALDSMDRIELSMSLEEEFQIFVSDDEIDGWNTVGDVAKCIDQKGA